MSDRHPLYRKEPWLSKGLTFFPVGNFFIFYITRESDCTVHVLRLMYGGRNVEEQLKTKTRPRCLHRFLEPARDSLLASVIPRGLLTQNTLFTILTILNPLKAVKSASRDCSMFRYGVGSHSKSIPRWVLPYSATVSQ